MINWNRSNFFEAMVSIAELSSPYNLFFGMCPGKFEI